MSRMMPSGGRRMCTRSIQAPDRSRAQRGSPRCQPTRSRTGPSGVEAAAGRTPRGRTHRAHGWISGEPLGVVDVLVAGEAAVRSPAARGRAGRWPDVLPAPALGKSRRGHRGQAAGVVQDRGRTRRPPSEVILPHGIPAEPAVEGDRSGGVWLHQSRLPSQARYRCLYHPAIYQNWHPRSPKCRGSGK